MKFTSFNRDCMLPSKWLVFAWLALPQIAETILAPALPDLARVWQLDPARTQWVMGVFFLGFSSGVLLWGQIADQWGRRPALLLGLILALAGTIGATLAPHYEWLVLGRFFQAVGMATCSVTTQTMLRDRLQGDALARYFITLGIVLSWSPAVGPLVGQILSNWYGYHGVFWMIAVIVSLLIVLGVSCLNETRPPAMVNIPMKHVVQQMLIDRSLWCAAVLVAGLNALVFSFYAAGPFMVGQLPGLGFGWVGLAVALASSLGAAWNRRLPGKIVPDQRVRYGLLSVLIGILCQLFSVWIGGGHPHILWAITALPVFVGFGIAIPNILASALRDYRSCLGRAGALFGMTYYLLLGIALTATTVLPFDTPLPLAVFWLAITIIMLVAHHYQVRGKIMQTAFSAMAINKD